MSSDPVAASIATSAAVEQETTVSGASECSRAKGRAAAATAPVLIYVGVSMMAGMRNLDYTDIAEYIPAFLCIAFTAYTFNIANGISVAFIAFVLMKVAAGRMSELHKGHYLLALLLAYYFYAIAGVK